MSRSPGLVRGREHSAIIRPMEPQISVRFTGRDKLLHLIEAGEMAPRLGRRFAKRLHEPFPDREGSPDGSEALGRGQTGSMNQRFPAASYPLMYAASSTKRRPSRRVM